MSKNDFNKVINTNLIGTINILKKAKIDRSKIIFLSSSRVYSITGINKPCKTMEYHLRMVLFHPKSTVN